MTIEHDENTKKPEHAGKAKQICTRCRKVRLLEKFDFDPRYEHRRMRWCRDCVTEYQRDYASSDAGKAKRREAQRRYMQRLRSGEFAKEGSKK